MQPNRDNQTPREVLTQYYIDNGFLPDGGEASKSVKIYLLPSFPIYFPNFDSRRKVILKHDLHHLVTGYANDMAGESEISTWEIASGCKGYTTAFLINSSAVMTGVLFNLRCVLRAFARGRRTKNLYHDLITNNQAMDMKIAELRKVFDLDKVPIDTKPTLTDILLFGLFLVYGLVFSLSSVILIPLIFFYSLYVVITGRNEQHDSKN